MVFNSCDQGRHWHGRKLLYVDGFYFSARLNRGDYRTKQTNGIVEIYVPSFGFFTKNWKTVCADTFTDKEAGMSSDCLQSINKKTCVFLDPVLGW